MIKIIITMIQQLLVSRHFTTYFTSKQKVSRHSSKQFLAMLFNWLKIARDGFSFIRFSFNLCTSTYSFFIELNHSKFHQHDVSILYCKYKSKYTKQFMIIYLRTINTLFDIQSLVHEVCRAINLYVYKTFPNIKLLSWFQVAYL